MRRLKLFFPNLFNFFKFYISRAKFKKKCLKKFPRIWDNVTTLLSVRSYTISLGNFGLQLFLRHDPPRPLNNFFEPFVFLNLPKTWGYVLHIFVYFCQFSILLHMIFFKKVSELRPRYPKDLIWWSWLYNRKWQKCVLVFFVDIFFNYHANLINFGNFVYFWEFFYIIRVFCQFWARKHPKWPKSSQNELKCTPNGKMAKIYPRHSQNTQQSGQYGKNDINLSKSGQNPYTLAKVFCMYTPVSCVIFFCILSKKWFQNFVLIFSLIIKQIWSNLVILCNFVHYFG